MTDWNSCKVENMAAASVRDNKAQSRFELDVEGAVAFANYRLAPGAVIITHTETPRARRGRGIASELVQGALQLIRADRLKVVAGAASWRITCASIRSLRIWRDEFNVVPANPLSSPRKRGPILRHVGDEQCLVTHMGRYLVHH